MFQISELAVAVLCNVGSVCVGDRMVQVLRSGVVAALSQAMPDVQAQQAVLECVSTILLNMFIST